MHRVYGAGVGIIVATFLADVWFAVDYWRAAAWSLTFGAVFITVFTVLYGFRSNWWSNRIGKIFFAKSILLTVTMWQIVATTWIGQDYLYRNQIRFVIYAVFALAYITMDIALWREQQRDRRVKDEPTRHLGLPPL